MNPESRRGSFTLGSGLLRNKLKYGGVMIIDALVRAFNDELIAGGSVPVKTGGLL